jgi:hypothetical protein
MVYLFRGRTLLLVLLGTGNEPGDVLDGVGLVQVGVEILHPLGQVVGAARGAVPRPGGGALLTKKNMLKLC